MADYYGDRTIPNRVKPGGDLGTKEYFYTADKKTGLISVHRIVTSNNAQDDVTIGTINPNAASITVNQNASAAEIAHWRKPNNIANAKSTAANVAQKEWSAEPIGSRNPQSPKSQILKTDATPTELTSTPTDNKQSATAKNTKLGGTKTGGFGHLRYPKNINETQRDVLIIDMLEYVAQGIGNLGKGKFGTVGYLSGAKLGLRSLVDEGLQQAFKTVKVGDDIKNVPLIKQFIQTIFYP